MGLCLTRQTNKRLRFSSFDVTKLLDLFTLPRRHVRKFFSTAQHANPASATRSRATLNGDWSFNSAWINFAPVARAVVGSSPGKILHVVQFVPGAVVVFVVSHGPTLIDSSKKA